MASGSKRRLVFAVLGALSLWPVAHHALVASFDMDPWRLLGFSMYATPKRQMKVLSVEMGWPPEVPAEQRALAPEQRTAFDRRLRDLRNGRKTLGRLYPWRATMGDLLALLPDEVGRLTVTLSQSYVDPQAMLRIRTLVFRCDRGGSAAQVRCRES